MHREFNCTIVKERRIYLLRYMYQGYGTFIHAEIVVRFERLYVRSSKLCIAYTDAKPYNDLLIAPAYICTLCIVRYLTLNIGISMKGAIMYFYCSNHIFDGKGGPPVESLQQYIPALSRRSSPILAPALDYFTLF